MRTLSLTLHLVTLAAIAGLAQAQTTTAATTGSTVTTTSSLNASAAPTPAGPRLESRTAQAAPGTASSPMPSNTTAVDAATQATVPMLAPSNQTSGSLPAAVGVRPVDLGTGPVLGVDTGVVVAPGAEVIGANGERIPVNVEASSLPATAIATPTVQLTAAERAALQRQRARAARSDQILHSIAPRTDNDRADQMPDDPFPPTLAFAR